MSELHLRPHHALCIRFFQGKGYSEVFVRGMTDLIALLHDSSPAVTLICAPDVLCRSCPNCGVSCTADGKAARYDAAVLRLCGLQEGQSIAWQALCALTEQRILRPGRLSEVCGDCQWAGICHHCT